MPSRHAKRHIHSNYSWHTSRSFVESTCVILFCVFTLLLSENCKAQSDFDWAEDFSNVDDDAFNKVKLDGEANTFALCSFRGSLTVPTPTPSTFNSEGQKDLLLLKYDAEGSLQWATHFGASNDVDPGDLGLDSDGNIYVTGSFWNSTISVHGTVTITASNNAGADIFLVKVDPSGEPVWIQNPNGSGDEFATALAVSGTDIFFGGYYENTLFLGGGNTEISSGGFDSFISRYSDTGNCIWSQSISGTGEQTLADLEVNGGKIYACGQAINNISFYGSPSISDNSAPQGDFWIANFKQSNGEVNWGKSAGGLFDDEATALTITSTSVVVAGNHSGMNVEGNGLPSNGFTDVFMIEYDQTGNLLALDSEGGAGWESCYDIVADQDDEIFICGSFSGSVLFGGTDSFTPLGTSDAFLSKYSGLGTYLWTDAISSNGTEEIYSIDQGGDQRLSIGGIFKDDDLTLPLVSGPTTLSFQGGYDGLLTQYNDCVDPTITNNSVSNSNESLCIGDPITLLDGTTPVGGDGNYLFEWQRSFDDGVTWETAIGDAGSEDYTSIVLNQSQWFRRKVSSTCATPTYSNSIEIEINDNNPSWEYSGTTCVLASPINLDDQLTNGVLETAGSVESESGVSNAWLILGNPDTFGAPFYQSGDMAVLDMGDTILPGWTYQIKWGKKWNASTSATIKVSESIDAISFSSNPFVPTTDVIWPYEDFTFVAQQPTRYIKIEHLASQLEVDAITFQRDATPGGTWTGTGVTGNMFDPATAGVGDHVITYSVGSAPCNADSSRIISVAPTPSSGTANISSSNICPGNSITLTLVGATGNIQWESSPDGGSYTDILGATTTLWSESPSADRYYRARVEEAGCGSVYSNVVNVAVHNEDASFSYSSALYCIDDSDPTPTISGTPGGTFSEASGNVVLTNSSTGEIDLSLSIPGGPYTIDYVTPNGCDTQSFDVSISDRDTASFSFSATAFCSSDSNPTATISGTSGGSFSCSNANIVFANTSSGEIDLSSSIAGGPYSIIYTTSGPCPDSSTFAISITQETTANAGPDQTNLSCGTTSTILLASTPPSGSGTWTIQSGSGGSIDSVNDPNSSFSGTAGETYVLRWTISNAPCADNYDEVTIAFPNEAITADAGVNQTGASMCNLTSTTLAANNPFPGSGTWIILSGIGGSFADATDPTTVFTGLNDQTYILEWTINQAPCPNSSDTVTIDFPHNPSGAYAGTDKTGNAMCGVTSITMNASSPAFGTGNWSVISGIGGSFDNPADNTALFTGISGETYTLRWTVSNPPCGSTFDEITVEFLPVPSAANAGTDQTGATLCGTTSVILDANTPTSGMGTWTVLSGTGGTFSDVNDPTTTFSGIAGSTYELVWTISTGYCTDSSDSVWIEFTQNPTTANAGADIIDDSLCGLTDMNLAGNTPAVGIGTWTIESGTGGLLIDPADPNTLFSGIPGTMYTLRWTISNIPCADSFDEVTIYFPENPTTADAGMDQTDNAMCGLTTTTLSANTPSAGIGIWSIITGAGGSFADVNDPNTPFTGSPEVNYVLRWTISNPPCADSFDEVNITFYGLPTLADAGPDQTDDSLCGLTNTSLNANVPTYGTGTWSVVSGIGGLISDVNNSNSAFNGIAGEHYVLKWTITTANCGSTEDTVEIWFGQEPTTASAGPNQNGSSMCGSTSTVLEGNTPTIGSGLWTVESGIGGTFNDPSNPNTTFNGIGGNSYVLRWTISNAPCPEVFDEMIVTFYQGPSPADAGPNQLGDEMCGLSSTILDANAPGVGTASWSIISGTGGTFSDNNDPNATFSGTPGESYTLRWTIGQIPCGVNYDEVDITFHQEPSPADAGLDKGGLSMCGLEQTTLEAVLPAVGIGTWTILQGTDGLLSDLNDPASVLFGTNGETYTLLWSVSNGPCSVNTDTLEVEFTETPDPANAGVDMLNGSLCGETDLLLTANDAGNATGTWTILSGTGGSFEDINDPHTQFSGLADETYQLEWIIDNGVCPATADTVDIHFDRPPSVAWVGPDQDGDAMCGITMAGIAANTPTFGSGEWTIESGTGGVISNPTNPTTLFTGITGESYTLRWTVSLAPCPASYDELIVTFHPLPGPVSAGDDQDGTALCGFTAATLNAETPSVGSGQWSIVSGSGGSFVDENDPHTAFFGMSGSSYELQWTVSSPPCEDISDTVNITFPALPTTSNAGPDQTGSELCGLESTQLEANMPTIGTGSWSIVSGMGGSFIDPNNPETTFNGVIGNTYDLKWSITNSPCVVSEDLVTIYFPSLPSEANGGADQTGFQMCGLTSIDLEGEDPAIGSGTWSVIAGENGTFSNTSNPESTFSGDAGGEYTLVWTTANESCVVSTDTVIVVFENLPVEANAGPDQQICLNETTTLFGNNPGVDDALWLSSTSEVSLSSIEEQETTFSASSPGEYEVVWSIGNGLCAVSADTMIVEVLPVPMIEAGLDSSICGHTIQLYGIGDDLASGVWTTDNDELVFEDITDIQTTVTELSEGTNVLVWEATDGTCTAVDTITINSHIPWEADAGLDVHSCGIEAPLQAIPQSGIGTWSSSTEAGFWPDENNPEAVATSNFFGSFTFTWTETDGVCTSSDDINVTFWEEVEEANAGDDQVLTDEYTATVEANNPTVGHGFWTSPNDAIIFADSLEFNTEVSNLPYGSNMLTWTIANGACESSSDDLVILVNQSELPTGFSPNNDGSNDVFEIKGLEQMADTRLSVFDRWGNMVYDMENYDNTWDGTSSGGVILSDDTYFYTFRKDGVEISSYVVIRR